MLTLQTSFTYEDTEPAPVDQVTVVIAHPLYEVVDDTASHSVALAVTGSDEVTFVQNLAKTSYYVSIKTQAIFGPNYGQDVLKYLGFLTQDGPRVSIGEVTIPFTVRFGAGDNAKPKALDCLYFFAGATLPAPRDPSPPVTRPGLARPAEDTPTPIAELRRLDPVFNVPPALLAGPSGPETLADPRSNYVVDSRIFCVNKTTYVNYLNKLFPGLPADDECILLYLIAQIVDVSGPSPKLASTTESSRTEAINRVLKYFKISDAKWSEIQKGVVDNFAQFFDFPLSMPPIQLLSVAGNLTLNPPVGKTIALSDFAFYHLSASFSVITGGPDDEATQHISRYSWPANSTVGNNTLNFDFKDKYMTDAIRGPVEVVLAGYDNSELYSQEFAPTDPALRNLNIVLDLHTPPVLTGGAGGRPSNKKLRGKVVAMAKNCTLKASVIVQAKDATDSPWKTVSTGDSDKAGNFTMPYPFGKYIAAQAISSLDTTSVTPLKITNSESATGESIASDFIYILLQSSSADPAKKEDCGCTGTVAAGRLPSQADIIQSDQYTQDVGGGCTNLTVPNRTLREYRYTAIVRNSDPDVANYTLTSVEAEDPKTKVRTVTYTLTNRGKVTRHRIDLNNQIQWEDASSAGREQVLYEAVTVSTGHVLHYKSEFRADGYSLGNLLYSLPLAPGQKKEIAIIDASHAFRGTETQALSQSEQLAADLVSERDITDQIGGNIGEQLAGSSEASTGGVSVAAGASYSGYGFGANVGVAGGYSKASSSAQQNSGRNLGGFFNETIRQGIHQNAVSYRRQNSSIVTTASEAQRYQAETTVVANHNHCHSLTIMHYEVLRHFAVYQELVDVEECVFIPFPLTKFSPENISRWSDVLCTRLLPLPANTYKTPARLAGVGSRHPLAGAFDAVERVRTKWSNVDWPDARYCDEIITFAQGEFTASVKIPRPKTRYDMIKSLPIVTQYNDSNSAKSFFLGVITGGLSWLLGGGGGGRTETQVRADISDKFIRLDANYQTRRPADCIRLYNLDPLSVDGATGFDPLEFFHDSPTDLKAWRAYANVLGYLGTDGIRSMLKFYFLNATIAEWDGIWNNDMAPKIYRLITGSLSFDGITFGDSTPVVPYRGSGGLQQTRVTFSGQSQRVRKEIQFFRISCTLSPIDLKALLEIGVEYTMQSLRISYTTQHYNGILFAGSVNNDLLDGILLHTPLSEAEMRYPKAEDQWLAQRLITHLNQNLEYYNRVLLYSLDPQRRFMILDGFHIEVYKPNGSSAGYHSLSSVLKNSPIAMAGNSMVFPVSPGYKVDQSMIVREPAEGEPEPDTTLLDFYRPETPPPPYRLSVPSRGVYSEAMMGACDACEKVKPDSSQDWTKFTTDEPTAINAIQPPVPQVTTYQPTVKDFATPMISIQNAPSNPDPGAGLAGITELLGKAGVFKDITGLDANQQNAIKTYLSNQESARAVAGMAGNMATQSHNTNNSPQIMDTIQQAQTSGLLTQAEAGQLVKQHIQSQIDGGQTQKAALEQQKAAAKPTLSDAAVAAVTGNKQVEATTVDGEGNVSTVKISSGSASTSKLAVVSPAVPIIKQKKDTPTCWAAAATMLASWKAGKTLTPEEALKPAGEEYVNMWTTGLGMPAKKKDAFIAAMDMVGEPPASYPPSTFVKWMNTYGPLWVTTDAAEGKFFSPHAKVLIQIDGDGNDDGNNTTFTWINPLDGSMPKQSFKDFLVGYEEMATDKKGMLFTQIVHLKDEIKKPVDPNDPGEGFGVDFPFPFLPTSAVHENMVISALINSAMKLDPTTTYDNAKADTREYLRGVIWNDDPAVLFFDDDASDNWNFNYLGARSWYYEHFNWPKAHERNENSDEARKHYWQLTERSHYWDLQFVHAMASTLGEDPHHTLGKIMLWLEVMYRLASNQGISPGTKLEDVSVAVTVNTPTNPATYRLTDFFTPDSQPPRSATLQTLLCGNQTKYSLMNIRHRALGSMCHTLQDSFAKGHTHRKLLNPSDLLPNQNEFFKSGSYAALGEIERFHTYKSQDIKNHGTHDQWDEKSWGKMYPAAPSSFNPLWGARMACDKSRELVDLWRAGKGWNEVEAWLREGVFALSANAGGADASV